MCDPLTWPTSVSVTREKIYAHYRDGTRQSLFYSAQLRFANKILGMNESIGGTFINGRSKKPETSSSELSMSHTPGAHQIANLVKLRSQRGFAVPKLIIALLCGRFQESSLVYIVYCVE